MMGLYRWLWLCAAWWPLGLVGCSNWLPEMVPYGAVTSPDVNRSLNGLGLHRELWEAAGARVVTPQRLSPRLENVQVVVLVGQTFAPPDQTARQWLEEWLAADTGRTVIYFGRDFNADVEYRRQTLADLPSDKRQRGAELLAIREAQELLLRLQQLSEDAFEDWFDLDTHQLPLNYERFAGSWFAQAPELNELPGSWPVRTRLRPPPAAEAELLLTGDDGLPLVYRLQNSNYAGSQILVVTNGAPLLNGSLMLPLQQRLGELLVEAALPAERVALIAYDSAGLSISDVAETDGRGAGLEMLTVWPLSGITMPAALLGIIVCAAWLPILGRPQKPRTRQVSDFGLHIDALGRMLHEARDLPHAQQAISDYYRQVRGESPPEWLGSVENSE